MTDAWKSETLDKLCAALAAAQGSFQTIGRTREVKAGSYTFKYAPLDEILNVVRPALSKNGLSISQMISGDVLRTALMHSSGQWLAAESQLPPRPPKMQDLGSMLTYLRRYALVAMLGVASEEDDDANVHDGNQWEAYDRSPTKAPKKPKQVGQAPAPEVDEVPETSPSWDHPREPAEPPTPPAEDGMPEDLATALARIEACKSLQDLALVGADIGTMGLEPSLRGVAVKAYKVKQGKLTGGGK